MYVDQVGDLLVTCVGSGYEDGEHLGQWNGRVVVSGSSGVFQRCPDGCPVASGAARQW